MADMPAEPAELIYQETLRRLVTQEARIDDMRGRALTILGAAGVAMGLFGISAFATHLAGGRLTLTILAIVCFAGIATLTIVTQLPFKIDQGDQLDPWLVKLRDPTKSAECYTNDMAHAFASAVPNNRPKYLLIANCLLIANLLFGAEILLWAVSTLA